MPDFNLTRINGTPYSWTSCSHFFGIPGLPYKGVVEVNYEETREVEIVHGAQQDGRPLGMTSGIYEVGNVSFKLLRESAANLMQDLSILGLGSFGDAQFNYTLQLFEPAVQVPPALPITTMVVGCRVTGVKDGQAKGVEALTTEFTCKALYIVRFTVAGVPQQLWSAVRSLLP